MNSMIYRMLVLNSGQVPWSMRKQIETIFIGQIDEISSNVPGIDILRDEDDRRRSQPKQYPAEDLIELYLVFGSRKEKVETRERIAVEFTRLDITEATSSELFMPIFYGMIGMMAEMDFQFGRFESQPHDEDVETTARFSNGKDIFASQPVRVGFFAAFSQHIFGRPGAEQKPNSNDLFLTVKDNFEKLISTIKTMNNDELTAFIDFETLNESVSKRSAKVGSFEREYFTAAFRALLEDNLNVSTMRVCWRAY